MIEHTCQCGRRFWLNAGDTVTVTKRIDGDRARCTSHVIEPKAAS